MQNEHIDDSWVLPSRQGEHPGRPVLSEALLHRRRERTFLVLATLFVSATAAMMILGASRIIDVSYAISTIFPDFAPGFALELPFGVVAFPVALVAVTLVCELYGRRRANALVVMGFIASLGFTALMYLADRLDQTEAAFGPALAFTACYLVAHVSNLIIFDALRRSMNGRHSMIRKTLSTLLAQVGGWTAFAFVSYGYAVYVVGEPASVANGIGILALGSALYVATMALVDLIPFAIAARTLTNYLRVPAVTQDAEDVVVDYSDRGPVFAPPVQRPRELYTTGERQLYTTGERRFFTEGEELSEVR